MGDTPLAVSAGAVRHMFDASLCRMQYDLGTSEAPWSVASFSGIKMLGIDLYQDEAIGRRRASRSLDDIRENPADDFLIAMPLNASITHHQGGSEQHCEPGSAMLFTMAQPFASTIRASASDGRYSQLLSKVAGTMLRARVPAIDRLPALRFDVGSGAGKALRALFEVALHDSRCFSAEQQRVFSNMLLDAVANVALGAADRAAPTPVQGDARARVREQALRYITHHLADPGLDVARVAAHCAVSERYLHLAFAAASMKIGAWIREQRLLACRAALCDPAQAAHSLTEIAFRWGFDDAAHFSHAYRLRFGHAPSRARVQRKH